MLCQHSKERRAFPMIALSTAKSIPHRGKNFKKKIFKLDQKHCPGTGQNPPFGTDYASCALRWVSGVRLASRQSWTAPAERSGDGAFECAAGFHTSGVVQKRRGASLPAAVHDALDLPGR